MNTSHTSEGKAGQVWDCFSQKWVDISEDNHRRNMALLSDMMMVLQNYIHNTAKEKGWWEGGERNPLEIHMLIVSELAEATEEARKGTPPIYVESQGAKMTPDHPLFQEMKSLKPEGELIELADAVIRVMDYCGHKGWNLAEAILLKTKYNESRGHRHGGKRF